MPDSLVVPAALSLEIPEGAAGTRETLKQMRELVRLGKQDVGLRDLANSITAQVPAKDWPAELQALLDFVRGTIRYSLDNNDIEVIQGAAQTLSLGYGDCDDMSILLATLCECVGHPCAFAALGWDAPGEYSHVIVMASGAGETEWLAMDATENHPLGWFPPDVTCELLCPITTTGQRQLEGDSCR